MFNQSKKSPEIESVLEDTILLRANWMEFDPFSQTTSIYDSNEHKDLKDEYPDWTVLYESEDEEQAVQVEEDLHSHEATLAEKILSPPIPQSFMKDNTFFEWLRELEVEAIDIDKQESMDEEEWVDATQNWWPVPYEQYLQEWEEVSGV